MSPATTTVPLGLVAGLSYHVRDVKPDDWHCFLRVLDETKACAEAVNLARE